MDPQLTFAEFVLDPSNQRLLRHGRPVRLSAKDFALLHYLVRHRDRLVSHAELLDIVWAGMDVRPDVLKVRIARLRRLLGDDPQAPRFIVNAYGEGYRFLAEPGEPDSIDRYDPTSPAERCGFPNDAAFVGRHGERARLDSLLSRAASHDRAIVFIGGEAGIGKTALVTEWLRDVGAARTDAGSGTDAWVGRGQCIEQRGPGEPYLPVLEALSELARDSRAHQLRSVLQQVAPSWLRQLPALSDDETRAAMEDATPSRPERMLRELNDAFDALTRPTLPDTAATVVIVLEDLQWADGSTLDLLVMFARRRTEARALLVGTYRTSERLPDDHALPHALQELRTLATFVEMVLDPLRERDLADYLTARFPNHDFPPSFATFLWQRTEGNPLFASDLLTELVTREAIGHIDGRWTLTGTLPVAGDLVPPTLRHLLARQRDRLEERDRRVLEAASVTGVEFSSACIAAALEIDIAAVEERCLWLAEHHQFIRHEGTDDWPDGTRSMRFAFSHALYQQLWYEGLALNRRREWHRRIGARREQAYATRAHEIAVELASHAERSGDPRGALAYRELAARKALAQGAVSEAVEHVDAGFAALAQLPAATDRRPMELRLHLARASVLAMTEGYGGAAVEASYRRAREICLALGDLPELSEVLFGLSRFFWIRRDLDTACELAAAGLALAERVGDPSHIAGGHAAAAQVRLYRGELREAHRHMHAAMRALESEPHDPPSATYGSNLALICAGASANLAQLGGYPERALAHATQGLRAAQSMGRRLPLAMAEWGLVMLYYLQGNAEKVFTLSSSLRAMPKTDGFGDFEPVFDLLHGWAMATTQRSDEGVLLCQDSLDQLRHAGAALHEPFALAVIAAASMATGRLTEARRVLDQAMALGANGNYWHDAELHRLDGELRLATLAAGKGTRGSDADQAEKAFEIALRIAQAQHAKSWELRTTLSLGRLWRQQGKIDEARRLVGDVFGWFTEGFDTPDPRAARSFLTGPA